MGRMGRDLQSDFLARSCCSLLRNAMSFYCAYALRLKHLVPLSRSSSDRLQYQNRNNGIYALIYVCLLFNCDQLNITPVIGIYVIADLRVPFVFNSPRHPSSHSPLLLVSSLYSSSYQSLPSNFRAFLKPYPYEILHPSIFYCRF